MTPAEFIEEWRSESTTVMVRTSGSTGAPKTLAVEKSRMLASARATCDFLGLSPGDKALLCMPVDYIAGKMMMVRAIERSLDLLQVEPSGHPLASVADRDFDLVAMVPMQVYNTLEVAAERECLRRVRHLIIGGGAVDDALARRLADMPGHVWSSYGMTETLSHIALRRLSGATADEWYTPMSGVTVTLDADCRIVIDAPAVCASPLTTNDIGVMAPDGKRFRIIGRTDNVICSGGIKIQTEEIEATLRSYIDVPFMISKVPDRKFGEKMVLLYEGADGDAPGLRDICDKVLDPYCRPRVYLGVDSLPLTGTGKPARAAAARLAASRLR